jgi:hypothetical protein
VDLHNLHSSQTIRANKTIGVGGMRETKNAYGMIVSGVNVRNRVYRVRWINRIGLTITAIVCPE